MTEITFQKLHEIYRQEKSTNSINEIDKDYEEQIFSLLESLEDANELENAKKNAHRLIRLRRQKIILRAFITPADSEVSALSTMEKEFFEKIRVVIDKESEKIEKKIFSGTKIEKQSIKKVKIAKDIPAYRGADSNEYGPYKKEEIIELPTNEAEWMIKGNLAQEI